MGLFWSKSHIRSSHVQNKVGKDKYATIFLKSHWSHKRKLCFPKCKTADIFLFTERMTKFVPILCHLISVIAFLVFLVLDQRDVKHPSPLRTFVGVRASPPTLSMWPSKHISHIQVLVTNFFPTPQIKLKLGLHVRGRLLLATHLDQSKLCNQS